MNQKPTAFLTDIMGTTTKNSMVKDLMADILNYTTPERYDLLHSDLRTRPAEFQSFTKIVDGIVAAGLAKTHAEAVKHMYDHIDQKAKAGQRDFNPDYMSATGIINTASFLSGRLPGHVYEDVPPAFALFAARKVPAFVYSTGSELLQTAMMRMTQLGDLTPNITGFFDTAKVGGKTKPDSYKRIADLVKVDPAQMLFASDLSSEIDAAYDAGLKVSLVIRPGNKPQDLRPSTTYNGVTTFADITHRF